jgi:hypothetical protein
VTTRAILGYSRLFDKRRKLSLKGKRIMSTSPSMGTNPTLIEPSNSFTAKRANCWRPNACVQSKPSLVRPLTFSLFLSFSSFLFLFLSCTLFLFFSFSLSQHLFVSNRHRGIASCGGFHPSHFRREDDSLAASDMGESRPNLCDIWTPNRGISVL